MLRDDFRVFEKDGHCALRSKFFDGARIKIVPTGFELENGILLHGDRFEAFNAEELSGDEFKLYVPGSNEPVEVVMVSSTYA